MQIIDSVQAMQAYSRQARRAGHTIALVPTMGYLHEGHLTLMRRARDLGDVLVVSIFVNPAQFGPQEDFEAYPRDMQRDCRLARQEGVDVVFAPSSTELYPQGYQTYIDLERLPAHLCGLSRPGHFKGVATVVAKLFNIVMPHTAVFGQKDYQQLAVIRRMTADLHLLVEILGVPTVREADGLAMSSRNSYLAAADRPAARSLHQALITAHTMVSEGITASRTIVDAARRLIEAHPRTQIDYIEICDPIHLETVERITGPVLMALAVKVGQTRLIDNMLLGANNDAVHR